MVSLAPRMMGDRSIGKRYHNVREQNYLSELTLTLTELFTLRRSGHQMGTWGEFEVTDVGRVRPNVLI